MDIKIHSVHFTADKKLIDFVEDKINKLQLFYDAIVSAEVFLRLENNSEGENKVSELKILIPGKELFAKKQARTFEEATDLVTEALRKQIIKQKKR
jgi:putative sigma-54 modulation protein